MLPQFIKMGAKQIVHMKRKDLQIRIVQFGCQRAGGTVLYGRQTSPADSGIAAHRTPTRGNGGQRGRVAERTAPRHSDIRPQ